MKNLKIPFIIRNIAFWLFTFFVFRVLFVISQFGNFPQEKYSDAVLIFFHALRLDFSTACIISILPFLIWSVYQFLYIGWLKVLLHFYSLICISIVTILSYGNIRMYGEWGTQINARGLHYLLYPKQVLASVSFLETMVFFIVVGLSVLFLFKMYKKTIVNFEMNIDKAISKFAIILLYAGVLVVGLRGGIQLIPINESSSTFSNVSMYNHIATNNIWYLGHSVSKATDSKNQYAFMKPEKAKEITDSLLINKASAHDSILNTDKPNIVFIVLESWTADVIEALDGEKGVTPQFDKLRQEGLLFTEMYSSGFRTEQGLISILSGFPAQPDNSIIVTPSKCEQLPSLNKVLSQQGYNSSFYYGGEVEFANIKSYLLNTNFEMIIDKSSFESSQLNSKWGAHDEFVLQKHIADLDKKEEPFFSMLLTLSTHEPFEVTMETPFNGNEESEKFKKAAYYTDHCLGEYFNSARQKDWYENTLFVLVADHGHRLPKNRSMHRSESHRLTALIIGGALEDSLRGKKYTNICAQHDLPATILAQLGLPYESFNWSQNIFDSLRKPFAYYANENVFGWITPSKKIVYSYTDKSIIAEGMDNEVRESNDSIVTDGKAYLQTFYQQYLDY